MRRSSRCQAASAFGARNTATPVPARLYQGTGERAGSLPEIAAQIREQLTLSRTRTGSPNHTVRRSDRRAPASPRAALSLRRNRADALGRIPSTTPGSGRRCFSRTASRMARRLAPRRGVRAAGPVKSPMDSAGHGKGGRPPEA
jgi:hypothetical protein